MRLSILTAILFLIGASAQARLGETPKQCARRYGEPLSREELSKDLLVLVYEKSEIVVRAEFGRLRSWIFFGRWLAQEVSFSRRGSSADRNVPLKDEEIQSLLSANSEGMSWREINMTIEAARETDVEQQSRILHDAAIQTRWRRTDGAMAVYNRRTNELRIRGAEATGESGPRGGPGGLQGF